VKISVVIPAYNAAEYLKESLLSVTRQTVKPHEILVVNDGSTDSTSYIANQYANVVNFYPNRGIGYARRVGSKLATGDYVCFLSADDCYEPNYIETFMHQANSQTVLFSDYYICDEHLRPQSVFHAPRFNSQKQFRDLCIQYALKKNMFVNFSTIMIPRSLFEKINFHENIRYGEDLVFLLEALLTDVEWKHISTPLLKYRVHKKAGTFQLTYSAWESLWTEISPLLIKLGVDRATVKNSMYASYRLSFNPFMRLKKNFNRISSAPFFIIRKNKHLKLAWRQFNSLWI